MVSHLAYVEWGSRGNTDRHPDTASILWWVPVCTHAQVLLKQDSGEYACIAEDQVRYNLGDVKEELMAAMGLNTEEAGSTMAFLRRGYKTSTWFEDGTDLEQHKDWRM